MPVSLDFLVQRTNCLIQSKSQPTMQQMAEIAGIINAINTAAVFSTSSSSVLPSPNVNKGRFVYLDDKRGYVYSDGISWTDNVCTVTSATSSLWSWGSNSGGELGIGDSATISRCSPVREFCSATDWKCVSISTGLKSNGELWAWGFNISGQIGDGTSIAKCSPVREFCSATDWCSITSNGGGARLAIKTSGQLWAWGSNLFGSLGTGNLSNSCSPVREFCSATDWLKVCISSTPAGPSPLPNVIALKYSGQIWVWGNNCGGKLGDGTTVNRCSPVREFCSASNWCQVSTGFAMSTALKTNGELWTWGSNALGELGTGNTISSCSPIREFCSATDWCYISATFNSVHAIKYSGELWAWGSNYCHILGIGNTGNRCSPVREFCSSTDWCKVKNASHVLALKTNGEMWAWGRNCFYTLGDGTSITRCSPIREFCSATDWCEISASQTASFAIKRSRGFNSV